MNPDQQTRLLIGTLVAAVIIVLGYGLFQEFGRAPEPAFQPVSQAPPEEPAPAPEPVPGLPVLRVQGDTAVVANTSGHQASVTADTDLAFEWSIQGGTIEGNAGGSSITWTAGTGAQAVLTCKGTNAAGRTSIVALRVVLRQPPAISRFEAAPLVVTEGSGVKLSWTTQDVQKVTLGPDGRDVSQHEGPFLEMKPEKTTTYTLTATNSTGITVTREVQVKVVPPPGIISLRAEPVAGAPTTFTVIGEFKGGKAELKNGDQVVAGSEASPLRLRMTGLKEGSSLLLTVTNEAGAYASTTLTFSAPKPY